MDRYYEQIDELILGLLVPARTQKVIDREIFQKFRAVGKLEEILDKILWDSPFKE